MSAAEQFKINLNQNLWGVVVIFGSLGAAEYYKLYTLFWFAVIVSVIMVVSLAVTTLAYTLNYWKNKQ
jgi:glucan phosphoethanolaminetransferase (alkaline phosphatase superfamily)